MTTLPALFVSHGAPNIILSELPARHFLETMGDLTGKPDAIVVVSAHFETDGVAVVSDPAPETTHDFGGFEPELYAMRYPAPGNPALAARVKAMLADAGLEPLEIARRGYDHGVWNPLKLAFPDADVPVVQVSVDPNRDAAWHYRIGAALAPLRAANILLLGSGHITHNLRAFFARGRDPHLDANIGNWVETFIGWIHDKAAAGDVNELLQWQTKAPFARENHPEAEHFMPFFFALGAGGVGGKGERVHHSTQMGFFAYDHYAFG
jgi:4,5-DOPA dioxygenase extradiol